MYRPVYSANITETKWSLVHQWQPAFQPALVLSDLIKLSFVSLVTPESVFSCEQIDAVLRIMLRGSVETPVAGSWLSEVCFLFVLHHVESLHKYAEVFS